MSMQWDEFFTAGSEPGEESKFREMIQAYDSEATSYDDFMRTTFKVRYGIRQRLTQTCEQHPTACGY